jgi:hypothetical protein
VPGFLGDFTDQQQAASFDLLWATNEQEARWCCATWGPTDEEYRTIDYARARPFQGESKVEIPARCMLRFRHCACTLGLPEVAPEAVKPQRLACCLLVCRIVPLLACEPHRMCADHELVCVCGAWTADGWAPWTAPKLLVPAWCDKVSKEDGNDRFTKLAQHPCQFLRDPSTAPVDDDR